MIAVVLIVLWCAVFALWEWLRPRQSSPPMYPGALPLLGHAHLLMKDGKHIWDLEKNLFDFSLKNGGVSEMRLGTRRVFVITDPDESLLIANTCLEKPYFYNFAKEMYSSGLVTASSSTWKPHRRLLNPAFNQQVLNTFVAEYNLQAKHLVSLLASEVGKKPFNIHRYLVTNLLKTVCQTSLGLQKQDQHMIDEGYIHAIKGLFAIFTERFKKIWLHLPYTFSWSSMKIKQDKLMKISKDIMNVVINKRKLELKANCGYEESKKFATDKFKPLLDQMLDLADNQHAFTDNEIREHLGTIVTAAYDTTATCMTYTLMIIGSNPDIQERIYKELQTVLGGQDRDLTKDDLPKLVYLDAVLKESLRLYSPVPVVARSVQTAVRLRNYVLPAGSLCLISLYGINRHPMWGPDADQFRPERWLDPASLPNNPNAFCSFSLGKRNCIGRLYAMMAMKTTLAHILRRYRVTGDVNSIETECDLMIKPTSVEHISIELRK